MSPKKSIKCLFLSMFTMCIIIMGILFQNAFAQNPNGISVGKPKVFDNRTLTIMLEGLNDDLRNKQYYVDKDKLAAAFSLLQGFSSKETVRSLTISPLPIPGLKEETTTNTGIVNSSGASLPDTTTQKTSTDRPVFTPQIPTLDSPPAFTGFSPSYGENPSDLLSDQVNLTYQIFNLRMLLERSLSDRITSDGEPRRQAVLGFNVSLDPPRTANDAVAVVEITLNVDPGNGDGLSLVSLMPQEKTYNSAALSTKSNSFGGSAVAKIFQVGYSERQRGQVFYVYRDNDTISYERMDTSDPKKIVFGWMFRPVLGRRSVSPGLRQLFAIVGLPSGDKIEGKALTNKLGASIRTYWKKYDRNTMTSFLEDDANRATRFKQALSLGLFKPEIFNSRYENKADYSGIEIKPTSEYQTNLAPQISGISWVPVGPKSALISIRGDNFFSNTQVAMGDKLYAGSGDGLTIKSNQAIDITTGLDAISAGPGAIIGRYGSALPLIHNVNENIKISIADGTKYRLPLSGIRDLTILLEANDLAQNPIPLHLKDIPVNPKLGSISPIITINNKVLPLPYSIRDSIRETDARKMIEITTSFPDSFLVNGGATIKVTYPFLSDNWTAISRFYDPSLTYEAKAFGTTSLVLSTIDPRGFRPVFDAFKCWKLLVGDDIFSLKNLNRITTDGHKDKTPCVEDNPNAKSIDTLSDFVVKVTPTNQVPEQIILISPENEVLQIAVPKSAKSNDSPASKSVELNQWDSVWLDIETDDASKVSKVQANGLILEHRVKPSADTDKPSKFIQVYVIQKVTSKAEANIDVTLYGSDGKPLGKGIRLHINPCLECGKKGGK